MIEALVLVSSLSSLSCLYILGRVLDRLTRIEERLEPEEWTAITGFTELPSDDEGEDEWGRDAGRY